MLPYLGKASCQIRKKLKNLFKKLPSHKLNVIFTTSYRISNMFRFKDRFPDSILSHFVYQFKCGSCTASYVGQTSRHQKVRFCEHSGVSPRTGKVLAASLINASKIKEHKLLNHHQVEKENFKVLSIGGSTDVLEIKESIMIKVLKPSLNNNVSSRELFLFN